MNVKFNSRKYSKGYHNDNNIIMRKNLYRVFTLEKIHLSVKKSILKQIIKRHNNLIDISIELDKYSTSRYNKYRFFKFLLSHSPKHKTEFINIYNELGTTRKVTNLLIVDQKTVCNLFKHINVKIAYKKSSKIHLYLKPYIEEILGYKTITEKFLFGFYVDEYCEELKLAIEIDGKWCHNKEKDDIRDNILLSYGIKTIRIPSNVKLEKLSDYFRL